MNGWLVCCSNRKSGTLFPWESRTEPAVARAPSGIAPVLNGVTTLLRVCEDLVEVARAPSVIPSVLNGVTTLLSVCEDLVDMEVESSFELDCEEGGGGFDEDVGMRVEGGLGVDCEVLVCLIEGEREASPVVVCARVVLVCPLEEEEREGEGGEKVEKEREKEEGKIVSRVEMLEIEMRACVLKGPVVPGEVSSEIWPSDAVGVVVVVLEIEGGAWGVMALATGCVRVVRVSIADVGSKELVVESVCEILGTTCEDGILVVFVIGILDGGATGSLVAAVSGVAASEVGAPVVWALVRPSVVFGGTPVWVVLVVFPGPPAYRALVLVGEVEVVVPGAVTSIVGVFVRWLVVFEGILVGAAFGVFPEPLVDVALALVEEVEVVAPEAATSVVGVPVG